MGRFSAKAHRLKGQGKHDGPNFIQLFHYVKRSVAYHRLGPIARALLIELIDRYNGSNNGFIALSVREAAYEIGCHQTSVGRAARELDDADLARPTQVGAWRGRQATEWRLTWRYCNKTGTRPRTNWPQRTPQQQLLLPKPKREPLSNAQRQQRHRDRKRNGNRNDELHQGSAEVALGKRRRYVSSAREAQNGNSSINVTEPSSAREAHVHIYHSPSSEVLPPGWRVGEGTSGEVRVLRPQGGGWVEVPVVDDPLVGTDEQRAALAALKAWRDQHG